MAKRIFGIRNNCALFIKWDESETCSTRDLCSVFHLDNRQVYAIERNGFQ